MLGIPKQQVGPIILVAASITLAMKYRYDAKYVRKLNTTFNDNNEKFKELKKEYQQLEKEHVLNELKLKMLKKTMDEKYQQELFDEELEQDTKYM
jgi:predicted nuclease with TOPRIM domain